MSSTPLDFPKFGSNSRLFDNSTRCMGLFLLFRVFKFGLLMSTREVEAGRSSNYSGKYRHILFCAPSCAISHMIASIQTQCDSSSSVFKHVQSL